MEGCKIFKPFLLDIINVAKPERIHIELQELPVIPQRIMNFRRRKIQQETQPWRFIAINPKQDNNKLTPFLEMLGNEQFFMKKIRRIGIICLEDAIKIAHLKAHNLVRRHYIFGQTIDICSPGSMPKYERQLSYVSIWDLEFTTNNLRNTKTILGAEYEKASQAIRTALDSDDLPF